MSQERTQLMVPAVASATAVHAAVTLTAAAQTVTTGITSPACYRAVSIKGNQAGVAGNVTVTGTDWNGATISDTIALSGASTVAGVRPFKTVTSLAFPALTGAGDTVSVGIADVFGLYGSITASGDVMLQERAASGANEFTIEATGTVNTTYDTVATAIVAGDRIRWTYLDSLSTAAGTALFTIAEARAFDKAQLANATTYPDATIEDTEADIRAEFAEILGFHLVPTVVTECLDGDGSSDLLLSYPEVTAVSAVNIIDTDGTSTAFTAAELSDLIVFNRGKLVRRGGDTFDIGTYNVQVTYTAGLTSLPGRLKRAALMVCVRRLVPTDVPWEATGGQFDGGINWTLTVDPSRNRWYGNDQVDGVLAFYRRRLPGIA